ncbi:restriction endonuclease subunit S, partial [Bradyrhizobium sp. NBAIM08]|uniref:restriction endonuclease subunit S n=1 Tax=Bradyrhizobium sp. NBAIM08 TaxID=2793815 RepID=UPI00201C877E
MKHIRKGTLSSQTTPVPPLDEQRRIAEVLRSVDQTIEAQDKVCRQLSAAFSSTLEACFTAADWQAHPLGDLCESIQVGIVVRPASYYVDSGGVPALRSLNVLENRLALSD